MYPFCEQNWHQQIQLSAFSRTTLESKNLRDGHRLPIVIKLIEIQDRVPRVIATKIILQTPAVGSLPLEYRVTSASPPENVVPALARRS